MSWFANIPIQRKLGYAILATSTLVLLLACAVFLGVEYLGYRRSIVATVATLARVAADNNTAAIAFSDNTGARQNLEALRAEPQIIAAVLYDADDKVFARYVSKPEEMLPGNPAALPGVRIEGGYVLAVQPVIEGSRRLGTLYVQATMQQIYDRMWAYSLVVVGVLLTSFGLASLLASILRRTLARPIIELATTAGAISANQDYSLRAHQYGTDELGQLTAAFNAMLDRTQAALHGLRESEWAHRELVRALPTAAYMSDVQGRITIFNEAAAALWGRAPEIGHEFWCGSHRMYYPDGTPLPHDRCPMALALREGKPRRGDEIVVERPDGTRRNVMPYPEPIRDTSGKLVGMVNMLVDITEQKRAGEAVRQLAAIVESSNDAIIGTDLNGNVTSWNEGAQRLFGYTAGQIIGQKVTLLVPPDHRMDEETEILLRIRQGERVEYTETVRCHRDGHLIEVSRVFSPLKDATGRIVGASKILRDITEKKRLERQANFLSHLSHELGLLAEPDEIVRTAAEAVGRQLEVDRCFFFTLSRDGSTATVKDDWARDGFAPAAGTHNTRDFGTPELWRAMNQRPLAVNDKVTHFLTRDLGAGYEALRVRAHATAPFLRQGEWISSLLIASAQPRVWRKDELLFLENIMGRVWPMVERAQTRRELRESEAQLRLVTDNAPIFLVRTDREYRFLFVNRAYAERNGFKQAEMIGMTVPDVVGEAAFAAFKPRMDEALTGVRVEFEMQVPYARLGHRWVHVIYVPERNIRGEISGLLGVISDVGSRKKAENELKRARDEAVAASRAKDDFLAALSHELRTPLNPVLLLASDAASNPQLPPKIRADFNLILKNVHLEARLIDDLLDLTRITRGKLHLERRTCDVHAILQDALANVEAELTGKKLLLEVDFGAKHSRISGDSVRLQQIFWNVLKNAVKFTPENGKVTVTTSVAANGTALVLRVRDTGIGMTAAEIGRVFQAFSQGDHAAAAGGVHRFGGLGLGLTITKMLVELHGGKIDAFSEGRNLGSLFQVELPLSQELALRGNLPGGAPAPVRAGSRATRPSRTEVAPSVPSLRRRILLVEDHAPTRQTLQHLLNQRNFEVTPADCAEAAERLVRNGEFDLLISDVGLPDRNGYELMTTVRSLRPGLPGIALSGYGMEEDLVRSQAAGFLVHLVKPVTIGMLEDAIASLPPLFQKDPTPNETTP